MHITLLYNCSIFTYSTVTVAASVTQSLSLSMNKKQESCAIAKMTARCALYK